MTTSLTIFAASGSVPAKRDLASHLASHLAALTDGQLQSLAYGEYANEVLDCDVPAWLAEAAYDEQDRRLEVRLSAGTLPRLVLDAA